MKNDVKKEMQQHWEWKRKIQDRNVECFCDDCPQPAINSHILQKNGIIDILAENRYVVQPKFEPFRGVVFKRIGVNEALTFKGFCTEHDVKMFKEIEERNFDIQAYRNQLLLSYRALVFELKKKIENLDWYRTIFLKKEGLLTEFQYEFLTTLMDGFILGMKDLDIFIREMDSDLAGGSSESFFFRVIEIPFLPVCSSTIISFELNENIIDAEQDEPLNQIILNIIPSFQKTFVQIGFHKLYSTEQNYHLTHAFEFSSLEKKKKMISNWLLLNTENWACSPSFYLKNIKHREKEIAAVIIENVMEQGVKLNTEINLFD